MKAKIGIRPVIDGRWGGIREGLENQTMQMAKDAKKLIEENVFYADGSPAEVVISPCTIGGGKEAAVCADYFQKENVTATLTVTPCWCYGTETMDLDPLTTPADDQGGVGIQRHGAAGRGVSGCGDGCARAEGAARIRDLRRGCAGYRHERHHARRGGKDPALRALRAGGRADQE